MNTEEITPVTQALDALNIPYRFFRHPGPVRSLEQAAEERGQRPHQVIRSLLFRLAKDEFVMVLVAGPQQVSWPALRLYLGTARMSMASESEVRSVTGYPPGAVSPFGLPRPLRILVDASVLAAPDGSTGDEISVGSGIRSSTVLLTRLDFLRALGTIETGAWSEINSLPG